jgi:hypothetical protein
MMGIFVLLALVVFVGLAIVNERIGRRMIGGCHEAHNAPQRARGGFLGYVCGTCDRLSGLCGSRARGTTL